MSARSLRARLDRLTERTTAQDDGEPVCVHHGTACGMGTRELPYLFHLVAEAKRSRGTPAVPLDEHRPETLAERRQRERELPALLAELRARNARIEAELRAERDEQMGDER